MSRGSIKPLYYLYEYNISDKSYLLFVPVKVLYDTRRYIFIYIFLNVRCIDVV